MGICGSTLAKEENITVSIPPTFRPPLTFGRDMSLNPADFKFVQRKEETCIKLPGDINKQQFIIEDCSHCSIYLLDTTATITVDSCDHCILVLGPCASSVFLRNCTNCLVMIACQQFRARDCKNVDFFLFTNTQPIIESSSSLRFTCWTASYSALFAQMTDSRLSIWNNLWDTIYDFTPSDSGKVHWTKFDAKKDDDANSWKTLSSAYKELSDQDAQTLTDLGWSVKLTETVLPHSIGTTTKIETTSSQFILFYNERNAEMQAERLWKYGKTHRVFTLCRSKSLPLTADQCKTLTGVHQSSELPFSIGWEVHGTDMKTVLDQIDLHNKEGIFLATNTEAVRCTKLYFEEWQIEM